MVLRLFGSARQQLPGQFLGEVWVQAGLSRMFRHASYQFIDPREKQLQDGGRIHRAVADDQIDCGHIPLQGAADQG